MKTKMLWIIGLLLLLTISLSAHAQQRCEWRPEGPLGPAWYQPGEWSACSNNAPEQPTTPTPRWASRWGAVAVDNHTGDVGTITDQPNAHTAERIALQRCGSTGCKLRVKYYNQCVAIAWGTRSYNASTAASIEEASERAMRICGTGANDCKVILTECSLPERVQ